MPRFPSTPLLQRITNDQWQHLLFLIGWLLVTPILAPPYRAYWLFFFLGSLVLFVLKLVGDAFFMKYLRYDQPHRGQVAALNSAFGLVLIWVPVLWLDDHSDVLIGQLRWSGYQREQTDGWPGQQEDKTQFEFGTAADGRSIERGRMRFYGSQNQRVNSNELLVCGILSAQFLIWTLQLLNRVFRETIGAPRPWRVIALGVMTAILSFLFVWRFVPWDLIWDPNRDLAANWLLNTFLLGLVAAIPISEWS